LHKQSSVSPKDFALLSRETQPEGRCAVCGTELKAGEGLTVVSNGTVMRFRCLGCLARFEADPERFLAGGTEPCHMEDLEPAT